jgi:protein-disulfide isomerase-like protein with CxxC motif
MINTETNEKDFDCIKMKREIQAKVYEETKDMTNAELLAYYNQKAQKSILWQRLTNQS